MWSTVRSGLSRSGSTGTTLISSRAMSSRSGVRFLMDEISSTSTVWLCLYLFLSHIGCIVGHVDGIVTNPPFSIMGMARQNKEGKYISISNLPNAFKTGDVVYAENEEIPDSYVMKTVLKENNGMNVFISKSSANAVTYEAFATFAKGNP